MRITQHELMAEGMAPPDLDSLKRSPGEHLGTILAHPFADAVELPDERLRAELLRTRIDFVIAPRRRRGPSPAASVIPETSI